MISYQLDALVQGRGLLLVLFGLLFFFIWKTLSWVWEILLWQGSNVVMEAVRGKPPYSGFLILGKYHADHAVQGPWLQSGGFFYLKFPGAASEVVIPRG